VIAREKYEINKFQWIQFYNIIDTISQTEMVKAKPVSQRR